MKFMNGSKEVFKSVSQSERTALVSMLLWNNIAVTDTDGKKYARLYDGEYPSIKDRKGRGAIIFPVREV